MQQILSDQISDFTSIYDEDVELVSISRPGSPSLERFANDLFAARRVLELRWQQPALNADLTKKHIDSTVGNAHDSSYLTDEITLINEVLHELLGCEEIGVRVTTLSAPMCPRFHIDAVVCRMLVTIGGPGTDWIANDDVDMSILANRDSEEIPIKLGREVKQFNSNSMSLLKGGVWQNGFDGVVHRSPHQKDQRLLLSFDPIFTS
ncbi:MAG: hypothetical protein CMP89_15615 [Gammaproteobacteria bacterium]|jgi:hypothetical protein|nr:hypothetical protein [Gammaproteobacteria bacterium]